MKLMSLIFSIVLTTSVSYSLPTEKEQRCILELIAQKKNISLNSQIVVPKIIYASESNLKSFNADVFPQWGVSADEISNVYVIAKDIIYIIDDADYYKKHVRFIEDSIAHEYVHYLQVKYQNTNILADESGFVELEAIDLQNWYRENYAVKGINPCF